MADVSKIMDDLTPEQRAACNEQMDSEAANRAAEAAKHKEARQAALMQSVIESAGPSKTQKSSVSHDVINVDLSPFVEELDRAIDEACHQLGLPIETATQLSALVVQKLSKQSGKDQ